ncbi:MAG: nucleotidyltransferase domain-containing protein [Actinobacteria bacterium]|nr:nucleotidyltransferase domain-containing protein [Actinomycetota bacterium]
MNNKILKKISNFFTKQKDVVAVYLYGSRAKGVETYKSDLDLAILFKKPLTDYEKILELRVEIQKLVEDAFFIDVREIHLSLSPVFLGEVISSGRIIFCRDEGKRIKFEVEAMRIIDDSEQIRRINLYYLKKSLKEGSYGRTKSSTKIT